MSELPKTEYFETCEVCGGTGEHAFLAGTHCPWCCATGKRKAPAPRPETVEVPEWRIDAREAKMHAVNLEQCSVFVESPPLKASMVDAAKFLRALSAAPLTPAQDGDRLAKLIEGFASALLAKLRRAEEKYGYQDAWLETDWEDMCRARLVEHLAKGDPLDVAAYCGFMWYHKWPTVPVEKSMWDELRDDAKERTTPLREAMRIRRERDASRTVPDAARASLTAAEPAKDGEG